MEQPTSENMGRIRKTSFPAKLSKLGNTRYISVPKVAIERMEIEIGDDLDVSIELPTKENEENQE